MDDLISRPAVLSLPKDIVRNMSGEIIEEFVNLEDVKALPSVQLERKGEWIANGDIHKECPFCGEDWDKYVFGEVWDIGELPNFCPNCGAEMERRRT